MKKLRFSTLNLGIETLKPISLNFYVDFDDTYIIKTDNNLKDALILINNKSFLSLIPNNEYKIDLKKTDNISMVINPLNTNSLLIIDIKPINSIFHPYDSLKPFNKDKYIKDIYKHENDLFKPTNIKYIKRKDGLYINDNNPEIIDNNELNKVLISNTIKNNKVFFTFEHNNGIETNFFYGYRVLNVTNKPIFITVHNVGFQDSGKGVWLGEREWTDFYNVDFRIKNIDKYSESQMKTYEALYGFANNYKSNNITPTTYMIAPNSYIYVMGGTTNDSYHNINVFDSANIEISKSKSGCSNGVVYFEIQGKAKCSFVIYDDINKVDFDKQQGYIINKPNTDKTFGRQYIGLDTCNGVVDANLVFKFNDFTPSGEMKVKINNTYGKYEGKGKPYAKMKDVKKHSLVDTYWVTHLNSLSDVHGVGTDMTRYMVLDHRYNKVKCVDNIHLDGDGLDPNIGNWMVDYIEDYTLVNYGTKDRKIKLFLSNNGSVCVMVKDEFGNIIKGTEQFTIVTKNKDFGDPIDDHFEYDVEVKAHSVVCLSLEYNLLANSCGHVPHKVIID